MSFTFIDRFSDKLDEMIASKSDTITSYLAQDYATYAQWLGAIQALKEAKAEMKYLVDTMYGSKQPEGNEDGSE